MQHAWQRLPQTLQQQLRELNGVHALHAFSGSRYDEIDQWGNSKILQQSKRYPPVTHPLVIKHPETGKDSLFINEQFTRGVEGLSAEDSKALLEPLFAVAKKPEAILRFQWQPGSVAVWDNRCTQHYAVTDYGDQNRCLHRVTVRGSELLSAE